MSTAPVPTRVPLASIPGGPVERLPVFSLVVLATMGFILVAMETMPAGLLPVIAGGLGTSEGAVGLLISAYALGTVVATIPAITLTRGMRRKPLLLIAITGLVVANTVTALSPVIALALASRFVAGAFSGVIWGMLAAYGRRISPPDRAGLSLSIVSAGAPVGFAFGTPLGSWLGMAFDWRWSFGGLTVLGVVVFALVASIVPDAAPAPAGARLSLGRVFRIPGIAVILAVIAAWMLAHNTIYTYVSPYLRAGGSGLGVDVTLLIYGIASIGGIVVTGALLDRHPRALLHGSVALFVVAGAVLLVGHASVPAVVVAAVLWGVTFGGASAQLQAALTTAGGDNADVANAFLPVAFNVAIFLAGIVGAALLTVADGLVLPVLMIGFGLVALALTSYGRRNAFPAAL
ncbi:MFS transporter [Frigoribacterium faeni]|uniref:MFS transporter n=1 Tax=Frigoribacterium faeni TaxID=145483 RepID=A0A7W3PK20_9MICO|nr:MFS transporter [Frigoribacterium faeni]MBA8814663.1 putative MFS family arabinose efflux permease [Frigoribacterium faeni]BFF15584.1 MFS transporter [Microbacterium flavescens]GEK84654.1 MFS transporter [Frigoribacterium faeni]